MQFAHPKILWLFLIYIPLIAWYIWKQRDSYATMSMSTTSPFAEQKSFKASMRHLLFVLRLLAIGCMIIMIARPQTHDNWRTQSVEGTDIVLAIDTSSSMLARDFKPDRLEAAKEVAIHFISQRENDNMGVVIFSKGAVTGVPLTSDRATLMNYVTSLKQGIIEDGTWIGDGIATAINRIKDGKAKSKSIILLTDGSNNGGTVMPLTAAEIAKDLGIRVYTIGVGTNGYAKYPFIDQFGRISYRDAEVVIDEATLQQIASITGGKYFRATNNNVLQQVFDEINQLETTTFDVRQFSHTEDDYEIWCWLALGLFGLELILRQTWLRTIP